MATSGFTLIYPNITGKEKNSFENILLIDSSVPNYQTFVDSVNDKTLPIVYSSSSTKNDLFFLLINNFTIIKRIAFCFVSEGSTPNVFLNNRPFFINNESIPYSENLKFILNIILRFKVTNIDYLECDSLNYSNWVNYYNILAKSTGVKIGASNNKTGNVKYGGDWVMESTDENIEPIYFTKSIETYSNLLDLANGSMVIATTDKGDVVFVEGLAELFSPNFLGGGNTTEYSNFDSVAINDMYRNKTPIYVSCSDEFSIILSKDTNDKYYLYGSGANKLNSDSYGVLGIDDTIVPYSNTFISGDISNNDLISSPSSKPLYVCTGKKFCVILADDGTIYGWGNSQALGNRGSTPIYKIAPVDTTGIAPGYKPIALSCGYNNMIVLAQNASGNRKIYGIGNNYNGQQGNNLGNYYQTVGSINTTFTEMVLSSMDASYVPIYVASGTSGYLGYDFTVIIAQGPTGDKQLYGVGSNIYGQLGNSTSGSSYTLTKIPLPVSKTPFSVSCGQNFTVVLMDDGTIYGTGYANYKSLGISTIPPSGNLSVLTPMVTTNVAQGILPIAITCAKTHTLVLYNNGHVYGTGNNDAELPGETDILKKMDIPDDSYVSKLMDANMYATISGSKLVGVYPGVQPTIVQVPTLPTPPSPPTPPILPTAPTTIITQPSCFPEKTPIMCDQGIIDIDKIDSDIHTINNKPILAVTKSIYELSNLVCIEKDALYKNVPSKNTLMTFEHKVFYKGEMLDAIELVGLNDKIYVKKSKVKFIYNVLLENYSKMVVNNLIVDTLHPESKIAKYYKKNGYKLDKDYQESMLKMARTYYKSVNKITK
uniref:DUF4347 domain-containing protein n=1 Tax=viral metagenome TaxID=1070528 RepID=A0A6C0EP85_9ZZZZ